MRSSEQGKNYGWVTWLVGWQCLLPVLSTWGFQERFLCLGRSVWYHLLLTITGYLAPIGLVALLCSVRRVREWAGIKYVVGAAWGAWTVALYYAHLFAWVGRLFVGMNLTPALIAPYVLRPSLTYSSFSLSPIVFWGVLLLVPAAILLLYTAASPALAGWFLRWKDGGWRWLQRAQQGPLSPIQQCGIFAGAVGLITGVVVAVSGALIWPAPAGWTGLLGDPIFVSLQNGNQAMLSITGPGHESDTARSAYRSPAKFRRKNVVLIVLDACRADHMGVLGYRRDTTPFLDELQRKGHLHIARTCYSASCCTFGGVLSLLRSQHWFKMTSHGFALQDVLKKAGYQTHFLLGGDHTYFMNLRTYYGHSIDTCSDGNSPDRHYSLNDDQGVIESLTKIEPFDGTPAFFYFHLMSVHPLGVRLPQNVKYTPASARHTPVDYANNYDNGVLQADSNIREIFGELDREGYLQNSLVVITGDHGDSMGERGVYGHSLNLYSEEVTPPLIIYDPEPVAYPEIDLARQIDVAPTILDRLGLPIPSNWDGHSLLRENTERFAYLQIANTYSVIDHTPGRTLQYIYNSVTKKEELYDVGRDPHEEQNILPSSGAAEVQELRQAIGKFSIHPGSS